MPNVGSRDYHKYDTFYTANIASPSFIHLVDSKNTES